MGVVRVCRQPPPCMGSIRLAPERCRKRKVWQKTSDGEADAQRLMGSVSRLGGSKSDKSHLSGVSRYSTMALKASGFSSSNRHFSSSISGSLLSPCWQHVAPPEGPCKGRLTTTSPPWRAEQTRRTTLQLSYQPLWPRASCGRRRSCRGRPCDRGRRGRRGTCCVRRDF